MHHPKVGKYRLCLPRSEGGRSVIQIVLTYETTTIGLTNNYGLDDGAVKKTREQWKTLLSRQKKSKIYDRFKHKRRKPQTSPAKAAKETKQQARSESLKNLKST